MATPSTFQRTILSFTNRVAILEYLQTVCAKAEDGHAEYMIGPAGVRFSDQDVADAMMATLGTDVSSSNVANIRKECIGHLRTLLPPGPQSDIQAVEDLRAEVKRIDATVFNHHGTIVALGEASRKYGEYLLRLESTPKSIRAVENRVDALEEENRRLQKSEQRAMRDIQQLETLVRELVAEVGKLKLAGHFNVKERV